MLSWAANGTESRQFPGGGVSPERLIDSLITNYYGQWFYFTCAYSCHCCTQCIWKI